MKKILIALIVVITTITFIFFGVFELSPTARKAKRNVENSFKLEVGMTTDEMLRIMGEPDGKTEYKSSKLYSDATIYFYQPPFASSQGIDIVVKKDTIQKIVYFE